MSSRGSIRIRALVGGFHRVVLEPGDPILRKVRTFATFDKACGYACQKAIALGRDLHDDSGRLSADQCAELVAAVAASGEAGAGIAFAWDRESRNP